MRVKQFVMLAWEKAYPTWGDLNRVYADVCQGNLVNVAPSDKAMSAVRDAFLAELEGKGQLSSFLIGAQRATPGNYFLRNAVWLDKLQPLLQGDDDWRKTAVEALERIPAEGLASREKPVDTPLDTIVAELSQEKDWREDNSPHVPVLDFMYLFSRQVAAVKGQGAKRLQVWLDECVASLGWKDDDINRLQFGWSRMAARQRSDGFARLLVRAKPAQSRDKDGNELYDVKAWLADHPDARPLLNGAEERVKKDHLVGLVNRCRQELGKVSLRPAQVRLELTFCRELLVETADQWPDPQDECPIGSLHSLVFRCWERAQNPDWSAELEKHVLHFEQHGKKLIAVWDPWNPAAPSGDDLEALWIEAGRSGGPALRVSLNQRELCCVCILEKGPGGAPSDQKTDLFLTLLRAGVPGILWARDDPAGATAGTRAEFAQLLASATDLHSLREAVDKNRQDAVRSPETNRLGGRIALIWDDPRYPPTPEDNYNYLLQSPLP